VVYLNVRIALPIRVVCVQCGQDLKISASGPGVNECTVACPQCGVKIRLIQAEAPVTPRITRGMPGFKPPVPRT